MSTSMSSFIATTWCCFEGKVDAHRSWTRARTTSAVLHGTHRFLHRQHALPVGTEVVRGQNHVYLAVLGARKRPPFGFSRGHPGPVGASHGIEPPLAREATQAFIAGIRGCRPASGHQRVAELALSEHFNRLGIDEELETTPRPRVHSPP